MNKKRIEKWIPLAIKAIEEVGIVNKNQIPSEFKGYISAFGASIIQTGLLPTVAFYESKNPNTREARELLPRAILYIITEGNNKETSLMNYIINNNSERVLIKGKVIDAAITLKLAIKAFKIESKGN